MSTIMVTGSGGFIASHLVEQLLTDGHHVVGIDNFDPFYNRAVKENNLSHALAQPRYIFIECDIRNIDALTDVFTRYNIEKVIHLAARAGVRTSIIQPELYEEINIRGTINLLNLCTQFPVKQFIFGSSSSVYGTRSQIPFSESDPIDEPISPYATSKRCGELFCWTYHHLYGIPITCLRFFTVYGPRQRPEMAIHKFTRLIDNGKEVTVYGDGTSKRDYTYISDIVKGIAAACEIELEFEIINLGNSRPVELREVIHFIEQNLGKEAQVKRLPMQPGEMPITYADIDKAEKLLGYSPKIGIGEGIRNFIRWYQSPI
jgi:UDP-glucuronate 4-epimerase